MRGDGGDPQGLVHTPCMSEILKIPWLQNWSDWRGRQHPRTATGNVSTWKSFSC